MFKRNKDPRFWRNERLECNCGSFALNVRENVCPYDKSPGYSEEDRKIMIEELLYDGLSREDVMEIILERDWEEILKECDWIEPINEEDIRPEDKVVAYRLCLVLDEEGGVWDDDFHFRVRIGGFWFEKNGSYPVHFCGDTDQKEPWQSTETLIYDSSIKYARFKNF